MINLVRIKNKTFYPCFNLFFLYLQRNFKVSYLEIALLRAANIPLFALSITEFSTESK